MIKMLNYNGNLLAFNGVKITPNNRGFRYGDSIFEIVKITNGQLVFWEDHYFQLMASMRMLRMKIPIGFTLEFLEQEILKTAQTYDQKMVLTARICFTRKDGGGYKPDNNGVDYLIDVCETNYLTKSRYMVDLYKDFYVYSGLLSTVKTNSAFPQILANIYAEENELDDCILLNERKGVVQATSGSIFLIKDNLIKTPALTEGCLKEVIREKIKSIISSNTNYVLEETTISPFELQKAGEIFIASTIIGIQPVTNFRKKEFPTRISTKLSTNLNDLVQNQMND